MRSRCGQGLTGAAATLTAAMGAGIAMAEPSEQPLPAQPRPARKPRILWASLYCLLDGSSGASMSVREMLRQLARNGYEITVVGATNFDNPSGIPRRLKEQWQELKKNKKPAINVNDGPLTHRLLITESTQREAMRCDEENLWHDLYTTSSMPANRTWCSFLVGCLSTFSSAMRRELVVSRS